MKKLVACAVFSLVSVFSFAQVGLKHHPKVKEVNHRIINQEHRITKERKEGDLTATQAKQDRADLKGINQEKKQMRKNDKGHLTNTDQKALNQQLNVNSAKIGK